MRIRYCLLAWLALAALMTLAVVAEAQGWAT